MQTECTKDTKAVQSKGQKAEAVSTVQSMTSEAVPSAGASSGSNSTGLDKCISTAILTKWGAQNQQEAFYTEAHLVLDTRVEGEKTTVYLLEQFYRFSFENDRFVVTSGHSSPVVMVFTRNDDDTFTLLDYHAPIEQTLEKEFSQNAIEKFRALSEEQLKPLQEKVKLDAESFLKGAGYDESTVIDINFSR
ncbi:hypothetical protein [Acetanaerobacterium elongatum]|uniref:Uncharacterized protein n=1 Tax=Acetanaerobacterium elongatum TaxID=258515 RepID=A0A1H0H7X4_9FIRM|nr:hypothetical protein [Acetanaerobacterium elongatum]SDO15235.1 hypothetical protein SAMN05192585_1634 [Acetanaerobacterium elongatum]